jgi:hypothetical protein
MTFPAADQTNPLGSPPSFTEREVPAFASNRTNSLAVESDTASVAESLEYPTAYGER